MSERAVEKHIGSVFQKLGLVNESDVNRRVMAVLAYLEATGGLGGAMSLTAHEAWPAPHVPCGQPHCPARPRSETMDRGGVPWPRCES